jgi:hypothetical protein
VTITSAADLRTGLAALDAAILAGIKTVVIGDETIVYQEASEMLKARAMFADQLATLENTTRDRVSLAVFGDE